MIVNGDKNTEYLWKGQVFNPLYIHNQIIATNSNPKSLQETTRRSLKDNDKSELVFQSSYQSKYVYLSLYLRVNTLMSTRTYFSECAYLNLQVRSTFCRLQLKSVQTTRVVCTNFSRSLYRLRRGFENRKLLHLSQC